MTEFPFKDYPDGESRKESVPGTQDDMLVSRQAGRTEISRWHCRDLHVPIIILASASGKSEAQTTDLGICGRASSLSLRRTRQENEFSKIKAQHPQISRMNCLQDQRLRQTNSVYFTPTRSTEVTKMNEIQCQSTSDL